RMTKVNLENLFDHIKEGETKELKIILKGDVQGSIEAVIEALDKLATELVKVNVVHSGVGGITEYDINFAIASEAIVIGFNVRPAPDIRDLAQREGVEIRTYSVIYELIDDITLGMEGMLEPIRKEVYLGRAEIREIFNISRIGTIAGCYVTDGKIQRNANVRLLRDDVEVHSGKLASLKRFKDDAKEVPRGMECGMQIENYNDVKPGDIIEAFTYEAVARKLADVRAKEEAAEKAEAADTAPQADA
ncbi:translation initiation factor IF-2, partial [bacterium]|nr:translation initiation factor IF-2 [bacterium]